MTDPQNTAAGFAGLIQLWTIQLRRITEGLAGMAGLSDSVLSQPVQSLQGLPHPGALSAAQLNLLASSVASQRQSIAAMQAQLQGIRRAAGDAGGDPRPARRVEQGMGGV